MAFEAKIQHYRVEFSLGFSYVDGLQELPEGMGVRDRRSSRYHDRIVFRPVLVQDRDIADVEDGEDVRRQEFVTYGKTQDIAVFQRYPAFQRIERDSATFEESFEIGSRRKDPFACDFIRELSQVVVQNAYRVIRHPYFIEIGKAEGKTQPRISGKNGSVGTQFPAEIPCGFNDRIEIGSEVFDRIDETFFCHILYLRAEIPRRRPTAVIADQRDEPP